MILSIYGFVALNVKSYGIFVYSKAPYDLAGILPTTEIIDSNDWDFCIP